MDDQTEIKAGFLDGVWKLLSSVKLTVVVLIALAVLAAIGTLMPQDQQQAQRFFNHYPYLYLVLDTLDFTQMYQSPWFRSLILVLVLNIIICSIERLRATWHIIFVKNPPIHLDRFRRRPNRREFSVAQAPEAVQAAWQHALRKTIGPCRSIPTDRGFALAAERGRWTRLGVYGVHLSVVVLLIGALIGSIWGFDGYVNIPEGGTAQVVFLRNSGGERKLPFTIRCDDFQMQTYDSGAPKEYRSRLTILENGRAVLQKDIIVNDPLRYRGINLFQSSYGRMGPAESGTVAPDLDKITLSLKSAASGMIYARETRLHQPVEIPEGLGKLVIDGFQPDGQFQGMNLGPTLKATLTNARGDTHTILLPLKFPKFDAMRRGKVVISAAVKMPAPVQQYYTGLQVTKDPGVGLVYAGFLMMIAGCLVTFFMSHRQVVIEVRPRGKGAAVMISGTANKNKIGLQSRLDRLADRLQGGAPE